MIVEFGETGLVERFPTAILSTGLAILSVLSRTTGLILAAVQHARHEMKRLAYLSIPGPAER